MSFKQIFLIAVGANYPSFISSFLICALPRKIYLLLMRERYRTEFNASLRLFKIRMIHCVCCSINAILTILSSQVTDFSERKRVLHLSKK